MRAVVNYEARPYAVELRDRPKPTIGSRDVLLKVRGVGVCGSDLHQWHHAASWSVNYPVILGHEFAGEIAEVGAEVEGFAVGDRVVSETAAQICGVCTYCRAGYYNVCPKRRGFGYGVDGAMADFVRVPARCLHRIPNGLSFEDAAMTEPGCVAANAVLELSHVKPGEFVVVIGPGPIGLMCLQMARLGGPADLWMVGTRRDASRLRLARELGATRTLVADDDDVAAAAKGVGDGFGPHLVVEATGISAPLRQALAMVRPMGQVTKVGWGHEPLGFNLDPLVAKAVRLQGSFSHTWRTWERVLTLYARGLVRPEPLRRVFPLEEWEQAFRTMDSLEIAKSVLAP
jgi:alcohol dehydrogenase/L-iditol 2-dehydrogenase